MTRYWVIAPANYSQAQKFERFWEYDKNHSVISIGWNIGDISSWTQDEMQDRYYGVFSGWSKHGLNQLTKFYHEIQPGDRIIARGGRKKIVGIGTVTGAAYFNEAEALEMAGTADPDPHANFLPVHWNDITERDFPNIVFGMHTVSELSAAKFEVLADGTSSPPVDLTSQVLEETGIPIEEQGPLTQTQFALEKYLEEFIVSNFGVVFGPDIQVYLEDDGTSGKQYQTDVGPIDILAWEPGSNSYVVMELKKGRTSDRVVGQTLRYMGWVKEHLCKNENGEEEKGLRGVIICRDWDENLEYAVSIVDNVEVRYYRVDFQLSPTPYAS